MDRDVPQRIQIGSSAEINFRILMCSCSNSLLMATEGHIYLC